MNARSQFEKISYFIIYVYLYKFESLMQNRITHYKFTSEKSKTIKTKIPYNDSSFSESPFIASATNPKIRNPTKWRWPSIIGHRQTPETQHSKSQEYRACPLLPSVTFKRHVGPMKEVLKCRYGIRIIIMRRHHKPCRSKRVKKISIRNSRFIWVNFFEQ